MGTGRYKPNLHGQCQSSAGNQHATGKLKTEYPNIFDSIFDLLNLSNLYTYTYFNYMVSHFLHGYSSVKDKLKIKKLKVNLTK